MDTAPIPVAICVTTFQRPASLGRLLQSFIELDTTNLEVELLVVENDSSGVGKEVLDSLRSSLPFPVTYLVETNRGISQARNRYFRHLRERENREVKFIALIDDDETVHPKWLRSLVELAELNQYDLLGGRAVHVFPEGTPEHIRMCFKFAEAPAPGAFTRLSSANLLIRWSIIAYRNVVMREDMGSTGGEDSEFTERLHSEGYKLGFTNDAISYEHVPISRTKPRWILARAYRTGVVNTQISRVLNPSLRRTMALIITSLGRIVVGAAQVLYAAVFQREMVLFRSRRVASGIGSIASLITKRAYYEEYAKIHGR